MSCSKRSISFSCRSKVLRFFDCLQLDSAVLRCLITYALVLAGWIAGPGPVRADEEIVLPAMRGPDPRPQPAVQAILAAFGEHEFVGLPVSHGHKDIDDFILGLIRNREFENKVNDIELECGNSLYQALLDRYLDGQDVDLVQVQEVWRSSPLQMCGTAGFWEELFPLVRAINARLPPGRKLRLLAAEPAIDWSQIKTSADLTTYMSTRDIHYTEGAEKEILAKHRKALLLFGSQHLRRADAESPAAGRLMAKLERDRPGSTYVILDIRGFWTATPLEEFNEQLEARIAAWSIPSIASIKGSWFADQSEAMLIRPPFIYGGCGRKPQLPTLKLSPSIDAVLYLGPRDLQLHELRPANVYLGQEYMAERERRGTIFRGINEDSTPKDVMEVDANPLYYNITQEALYVQTAAKMTAEANGRCAPAQQPTAPSTQKQ